MLLWIEHMQHKTQLALLHLPKRLLVIWHVLCTVSVKEMCFFLYTGNIPGHMACTVYSICERNVLFVVYRKYTRSYGMYCVQDLWRKCDVPAYRKYTRSYGMYCVQYMLCSVTSRSLPVTLKHAKVYPNILIQYCKWISLHWLHTLVRSYISISTFTLLTQR